MKKSFGNFIKLNEAIDDNELETQPEVITPEKLAWQTHDKYGGEVVSMSSSMRDEIINPTSEYFEFISREPMQTVTSIKIEKVMISTKVHPEQFLKLFSGKTTATLEYIYHDNHYEDYPDDELEPTEYYYSIHNILTKFDLETNEFSHLELLVEDCAKDFIKKIVKNIDFEIIAFSNVKVLVEI